MNKKRNFDQFIFKNLKSGNYLTVIRDSSSSEIPNNNPQVAEKENNLENQIQQVMDNNLAIKNTLNRGSTYELPPNTKIKIDYMAWFIQLLIWNIIVVVVITILYLKKLEIFAENSPKACCTF